MNPLPLPVPLAAAEVSSVDTELPAYLFLHELTSRGYVHAVVRDLPVAHTPDVLPEGHQLVLGVDNTAGHDHVALVEDCVVWLESWRRGGRLRVAAAHPEAARRVTEQLLSRLTPSSGPGQVRVEFADAQTGSRHIDLDVTPWPQISHLYPAAVVASMQRLAAHEPTDDDPRLLLWHGRPGTGKTTALRALLDAWRDWTAPVVVSDPGSLLTDGRYLRRILLDQPDDDAAWRLIVMEDAEALLRAHQGGSAVGKMLNLADGLLGQGLRCLFLLTTNQGLDQVHPALLRPGRCLSLVEFAPLSPSEASVLRGEAIARPMTLAEVMSREVDVVIDLHPDVGTYLYL
ncbi:MAG: AAA family ATPase [Kineosporiaceae bacterium]|nr:AAA family ATPase [Kineosporiaceae bacterium]MBK7622350.1 AAA family ATPase [Kineosporiaceae bacterium]MBK8074678.1 AAA family ATPase [Kineosporiaceae bacterium]